MLTKRQFKTASWGNERWGYIYKPDVAGKYPVVIFFHGSSETGTSSATADSLLRHGPLKFAKDGAALPFVVVALQAHFWSPEIELGKYIFENDSEIKSLWDGKNVMWTGLSAGGQKAIDAIALNLPGVAVPMSAANTTKPIDYSKVHKSWFFHDPRDTICPFAPIDNIISRLNTAYPDSVRFTAMDTFHDQWNKYYDPAFKQDGQNIYEWSFGAPPPPPPPPAKKPKAVVYFEDGTNGTVYDDKTYEVK